jgi:TRAP-type C4-dicarboxylate transport system substrate-binding protein
MKFNISIHVKLNMVQKGDAGSGPDIPNSLKEGVMKRYAGVCFAVVCILSFVLAMALPVQSQEIKLRYSTFSPPMSGLAAIAEQWCKEVEKRSNGRVKISFHPGGTLVPANQSYEGTVRGITDVCLTAQQWTAGRFPLTEGVALPIGVKNATQGTRMINAWYKKFKPKEYDDVKVLYHFTSGPSHFFTLKPLNSIKDLKGMKIRAAGETSKIVSEMGAVSVSIPISDAYDAFQRGVAQGVLLALEAQKAFRWGEVLHGMQLNNGIGSISTLLVVMNKAKWASLPPDIQKIIEQVSEEWIEKTGKGWDDIDNDALEWCKSKGMKVTVVSKEEQAQTVKMMKPLLDEHIANMKKLGLPGEESLKFLQDWLKNNP